MSAGLAERIERHRGLSDISVGDDSDYREYEASTLAQVCPPEPVPSKRTKGTPGVFFQVERRYINVIQGP